MDTNYKINITGTKIIELPYLKSNLLLNNDESILLVGERVGDEGILKIVLDSLLYNNNVTCTDFDDYEPNSYVSYCIENNRIYYDKGDFVNRNEDEKYDKIVCINVLEHFGMCWGEKTSIIDWNYDILAIKKMINICKKRIIITVPAGPPIFHGDCTLHGLPYLRRYDKQRMEIIRKFVIENKCKIINEKFYFSSDICDFKEVSQDFFDFPYSQFQLKSPNCIWAFCIEKL